MNIFDPLRPKINGRPAYFCYTQKDSSILIPSGIINWPLVEFCEFKIYKLHFYLRCNEDLYSSVERITEVRKEELLHVLQTFEDDPEGFIQRVFEYYFYPVGHWKEERRLFGPHVGSKRLSSATLRKLGINDI